jgi:hypothetical protein
MNHGLPFIVQTTPGKLSVWLNTFFVVVASGSVVLVLVLDVLSFDDQWWDITTAILSLATLLAFVFGLVARFKDRNRSLYVVVSILISVLAILFLLLHSLILND